ncbi:MAG: adenylate/guanylate cyclase domain-containing protein [Anaerolineae bacterium]|nr:adenylate/guanylate cyclase domain-containing protein [Anaerolineae bacterium]
MAEFGAPLPLSDHAERAVRAGLHMQRRLHDLRQKWIKSGLPALQCRVGINTGAVYFGRMGAEAHQEITVLGPVVNLAARLQSLGLSDIAARLDDRFNLLTSGRRGGLLRHQTLRALMDWSYELLTEREQAVLRRLGVFMGGWAIAEAEVVASDERLPRAEVLPLLGQLIAKSLVQMDEQAGETRYRLLETVREYALEKLSEHGEVEVMRRRHAESMLAMAKEVGGIRAFGRLWKVRSAELRRNLDNFRAVFAWSASPMGDAVVGLNLLLQFWRFWGLGLSVECARWTKQLLDVAGLSIPIGLRANALLLLGMYTDDYAITKLAVAQVQDLVTQNDLSADKTLEIYTLSMSTHMAADQTTTRALLEKSVAMSRDAENVNAQFFSRYCLAGFLGPRNTRLDIERSQSLYEEMIALGIQHEDEEWMAAAQVELSYIAIYQMEFAVAHNRATQALRLSQSMQAHLDEISAIQLLAELDQLMGNLAKATAQLQNASTLAAEFGLRDAQSFTLALQIKVESDERNHKKALSTFAEMIQYGPEYHVSHALGLEGLACSAGNQNQHKRAAKLCGAAEGLRDKYANPRWPKDDWLLAPHLERARAALGEEAYEAAYAEGRAMTLEQAIDFALH